MKRLFIIPIMFIYLSAVSGIMINLHYCGQELESWNLFAGKDGCEDGGCGDESQESDGCCQDKVITAKINADQNNIAEIKLKLQPVAWQAVVMPVQYYSSNVVYVQQHTKTMHHANAPPGIWQSIPLYKLHSSFTYYG